LSGECCCLPFGIEPCCRKRKRNERTQLRNIQLELPEICGQIKPTINTVSFDEAKDEESSEYKIYSSSLNKSKNVQLDNIDV
jgi:hypothetical protein